jgi:competence protein ComEC
VEAPDDRQGLLGLRPEGPRKKAAGPTDGTAVPLIPPTAAFVAGIVLAHVVPLDSLRVLAAGLMSLSAAWVFAAAEDRGVAFLLALAAFLAAGASLATELDRRFLENPLRAVASGEYLDLSGVLARSPGRDLDRDVLRMKVESVSRRGEDAPVEGTVRVSVPRPDDPAGRLKLRAGDRLRVSARFSSPRAFDNFGGFSYDAYLRTQNIHRSAATKTRLLVSKIRDGPRLAPSAVFSRVRTALQEKLETEFRSADGRISPEGAVLEALLLGEDGRLPPATVQTLQETGLYHLFAISGGHIVIIAFLLFSLLRAAGVNRRPSYAVLALFLVFYSFLVEASPSVLRATLMALSLLAGKLLWKDVHVLNMISASALALLLVNPASLFDVGFQLTYAATLAIIIFAPRIGRLLPRLPLGLGEMAALSAASLLGVTPIIVTSFNRVTFSSFLLNFAAIPLTGLIMGLGYVYLPFSFLAPSPARLLGFILERLVTLFDGISHLLDAFPFLSYRVPTPPPWTLAGYAAFLGLLIPRFRLKCLRIFVSLGFALFFCVLVSCPFSPVSKDLKVTMIDVNQGDSLLVEFPGTGTMLVDGGGFSGSPFDVGEKVVSPVLWRKGIKRIDTLVLTHPHPDHLNGLVSVAANFRIGEFWEAHPPRDNPEYERLLENIGGRAARRRVFRGFRRTIAGTLVEALHPGSGEGPDHPGNDDSLVLRITYGRVSILLAADIGRDAEREILEAVGEASATVLKSPHHGSPTSSSPLFLEKVAPSVVLISVGEGNLFGFPHKDVLERSERVGARVFRTDLHGSVEVATDGRMVRVRTASGESLSVLPPSLTAPGKGRIMRPAKRK